MTGQSPTPTTATSVPTSDEDSIEAYAFDLPPECIAQRPAARRSDSRLMTLTRSGDVTLGHHHMTDLPSLLRGDELIVFNNAQVVPARLRGHKTATGGAVELLVLNAHVPRPTHIEAMVKTSKSLRVGVDITVGDRVLKTVRVDGSGHYAFDWMDSGPTLAQWLDQVGELPLPPYIGRPSGPDEDDRQRYQTTFASNPGAVAAPTAGLHFDQRLMEAVLARGCERVFCTLHVGLGTFLPVRVDRISEHTMHSERFVIPDATAQAVNRARREGRPVLAVGTTVVRALEASAAASKAGEVTPGEASTDIFLTPSSRLLAVDQLLTNFHLPRSTLLMLVSAFTGRPRLFQAYRAAIDAGYRFFSYGDAMVIR